MSPDDRSSTATLMHALERGEIPSESGWQLSLKQGSPGWPADVRDLVSLGGDVVAAGNHWIIVTEELRDDIMRSAGEVIDEPEAVTIVMLDDLPASITGDSGAMDELHAVGWMTATGDAFVIPRNPAT